jgi:hypothetical protein
MTTKTDLQPCPFCGEVAFTSEVSGFWVAYCNAEDDDCSVNPETDLCDTEAEAINAWNTRPTDAIREAVEVCNILLAEAREKHDSEESFKKFLHAHEGIGIMKVIAKLTAKEKRHE